MNAGRGLDFARRRGLFLAQSNAAQRGTHIRHRNHTHFDPPSLLLDVSRPARDDDVLPAFRRRCWFATISRVLQTTHWGRQDRHESAGMRLVTAASR
jgi:hypothetical protein